MLLHGAGRALLRDGNSYEPVGRQEAPTWMGAIAVLTGQPLPVRMIAESDCELAVVAPEDFRRLAFAHPVTGAPVDVSSPLPPDLASALERAA